MASITASGSGSGLDIEGIISKLTAAERAPKDARLNKLETAAQGKLTAYNTLKTQLKAFQRAFTPLTSMSTAAARVATTSNASLFSVSATSSAATTSSQIDVQRLASAQKLASKGFASPSTLVGAGTLTITSGGSSFSVDIVAQQNNTLSGVRDAINKASGNTNVTASILTVDDGSGTGTTVSKLVLTSDKTGAANSIKVVASNDADHNDTDGTGISAFAFDGTSNQMTEISAGQDAHVKVDGFDVYSATNTVNGAIQGVTINLLKASPGNPAMVNVAYDKTSLETNIKEFVNGLNDFAGTMDLLTKYDPAAKTSSLLTGDFTARSINTSVKRLLGTPVSGASGDFTSLSSLGITTKRDGTYDIDMNKLQSAISNNFESVTTMLTGTNGVMKTLDKMLTGFQSSNGSIGSRVSSLNNQLSDIGKRRVDLDTKMTSYEASIRKTYSSLDLMVGQLKATGDQVSAQLKAMTSNSNN